MKTPLSASNPLPLSPTALLTPVGAAARDVLLPILGVPARLLRALGDAVEALLLPELDRYERTGELRSLSAAARRDIGGE